MLIGTESKSKRVRSHSAKKTPPVKKKSSPYRHPFTYPVFGTSKWTVKCQVVFRCRIEIISGEGRSLNWVWTVFGWRIMSCSEPVFLKWHAIEPSVYISIFYHLSSRLQSYKPVGEQKLWHLHSRSKFNQQVE